MIAGVTKIAFEFAQNQQPQESPSLVIGLSNNLTPEKANQILFSVSLYNMSRALQLSKLGRFEFSSSVQVSFNPQNMTNVSKAVIEFWDTKHQMECSETNDLDEKEEKDEFMIEFLHSMHENHYKQYAESHQKAIEDLNAAQQQTGITVSW
jgi:hypothetical protein